MGATDAISAIITCWCVTTTYKMVCQILAGIELTARRTERRNLHISDEMVTAGDRI